jgi:hypothetical protein
MVTRTPSHSDALELVPAPPRLIRACFEAQGEISVTGAPDASSRRRAVAESEPEPLVEWPVLNPDQCPQRAEDENGDRCRPAQWSRQLLQAENLGGNKPNRHQLGHFANRATERKRFSLPEMRRHRLHNMCFV